MAIIRKRELVWALGTGDRDVACYLAAGIRLRLRDWWAEARAMAGDGKTDHVIPEILRRRFKANLDLAFRQYAVMTADPDYDAASQCEADENALDVVIGDASDRALASYMPTTLAMLHDAGYPAEATDQRARVLARHMLECAGLLTEARLRWNRGQEDYRPKFPQLPGELFPAPRTRRQRREEEKRDEPPEPPPMPRHKPALVLDLVEGWIAEEQKEEKLAYEARRIVGTMAEIIGKDDATLISPDDVIRWKETRMGSIGTSTMRREISQCSVVWKWGKANRKIAFVENPFAGISPKKKKSGEAPVRSFTDDEARRVLVEARKAKPAKPWLRWLPWVGAYTGARLGEICHALKENVCEIQGVWCIELTNEDREKALKTAQSARVVPLHADLIAEGFLLYVGSLKAGDVLFPGIPPDGFGDRAGIATKRIGYWMRQNVGIVDDRVSPSHSWRHLFEERARLVDMPLETVDSLTGHETKGSEGRRYGDGLRGKPWKTVEWINRMPSILGGDASSGT